MKRRRPAAGAGDDRVAGRREYRDGASPEPDSPGLWVNPDRVAGTPGTFAVVVGVSAYPHLVGGAGPAADDAYDLPQLYVSALTAYRFFCWLRDRYAYGGSPLAQVWLLLAPTADELAAEPALREHALLPTFGNCEEAVAGWFGTMKRLPKASAQGSRALFFFSGHGLELYRDKQLLLPADYLRPPGLQRQPGPQHLQPLPGLAALEVPHQLFFADACRNDHQRLLGSDLEGTDVLNVWANYRANRNVIAPVLYASASGSQAWQPRTPAEGRRSSAGRCWRASRPRLASPPTAAVSLARSASTRCRPSSSGG